MTLKPTLAVRPAAEADLPRALEIFASAREFMRSRGNGTQWADWYPSEEILRDDISQGALHCIYDENDPEHICGMFALVAGDDPTYSEIFEGAWKNPSPYATVHRVASDGTHSGIFATAIQHARSRYDHLRIDTHKDNLPMQRCIEQWGFEYCGIIYIEDGTPRRAFEWTRG
ncbi:MAG: GNAT family N-acetyltransferase [Eggerthellaceae bacterium]|nr:GNAT family N-acetyltransferase [Eggerthellaceae bacterium]